MRAKDLITLEIKIDGVWTDYTDGILQIDIVRGIQSDFEGVWQQVEAGVLTFTSRNEGLDPYDNPAIRMGIPIRVLADNDPIFTGRINTSTVEYQPKGKPSITTIIAVDMIGTMALHTLRDTFKARLGDTMSATGMLQELVGVQSSTTDFEIVPFTNPFRLSSGAGNARNVSSGTTALQMATKLGQTNLDFFYADKNDNFYLYQSKFSKRTQPPKLQFDSRGGATSYTDISVSNGFDALINQLSLNNTGGTTAPIGTSTVRIPLYQNDYSVQTWGSSSKELEIIIPNTTTKTSDTDAFANLLFVSSVAPVRDVRSITFDAVKAPDEVHSIEIMDNIYIYHEANSFTINKPYGIMGIHHVIDENNWEITYNVANLAINEEILRVPTFTVTPSTGTTATDFEFEITNYDPSEIASVLWKFGNGATSTSLNPTYNYPLADVGSRTIELTVTNKYGFGVDATPYTLLVSGAAPTGVSWTYTANPANTALISINATATDVVSYTYNWGDGVIETGLGSTRSHVYATSGSKTVTVTAVNSFGSTPSTQTISVTVPTTPTDQVGTLGVRYIKISQPLTVNPSGYYFPLMSGFTAKTSTTLTNRADTAIHDFTMAFETNSSQPFGNQQWRTSTGASAGIDSNGACSSTLFRTTGLRPWNPFSGNTHWSIIIDLGAVYYDVKTLFMNFASSFPAPTPNLNVYTTEFAGEWGSPEQPPTTWIKIGEFNKTTRAWVPLVTMPPNAP